MKIIDVLRIIIQLLLIVWFVSVTLFVLVPSCTVLSVLSVPGAADLPKMPEPPAPPTAEELKSSAASVTTPQQQPPVKIPGPGGVDPVAGVTVRDARVDVYTQQVTAYTQQLAAYKSQIEQGKTRQIATYKAVVTDTLVALLSTALTAFLGYVFVKSGAELVNKYLAAKRGGKAEPLNIF